MTAPTRNILVTGGAGFIGSAVCRLLLKSGSNRVVVVDKLTYAGILTSLEPVSARANFRFELCDIADEARIARLLQDERIDCVMHLAAETHVDRSLREPDAFIATNIVGTFHLLQAVLSYWRGLDDQARAGFRFHHVSTDEVFGGAPDGEPSLLSELRYRPSSAYSASKAASDHLVAAWHRTYGLPVVTSHSSNTFGPYQFPDKLIPLVVLNALKGQPLPVYGAGANRRDWIYVDDHARALELIATRGQVGRAYTVAQRALRSNLDVVRSICAILDRLRPRANAARYEELITFVPDRPGHDREYPVGPHRADSELGWDPVETFESGLAKTVRWYLDHEHWWRQLHDAPASGS
jgi:dTDP-glucose 4,6-dehydratase